MKALFSILFLSIFITSCTNERRELSITLLFDKPIQSTKYPLYFKELTIPFMKNCDKDVDYLLEPINVTRLDISNKDIQTNAWHFKEMGDNTVDFSKLWLEQYFKDSLINPYLTQPSSKEFLFDSWLANSKDSLYILSEESDINEYKGKKVFNNTEDLYKQIQESICTNSSKKVLIVINPTFLKNAIPHKKVLKVIAKKTGKTIQKNISYSDKIEKTESNNEIILPPKKKKWSGENSDPKKGNISQEDIKSEQ
jgi:hypothetical protein